MGYHDNKRGILKTFKRWYWRKHCQQRKASLDLEQDPTPKRANVSTDKLPAWSPSGRCNLGDSMLVFAGIEQFGNSVEMVSMWVLMKGTY